MKRVAKFLISFVILFSLTACGSNSNTTTVPDDTPSVTI